MSSEPNTQFEALEAFQKWMREDFRAHCEKEYGRDIFANFIYPYYNDFMECVEYHIEDLGNQAIQEEELNYVPEEH